MNIHDMVGQRFLDPIKSNNNAGDVRTMWNKAQNLREKNQSMRSDSGKVLPYTLLYYVPGLTTYCGIRGTTVLTGYMSGCYLFRYRFNGELRAAHVGTVFGKDDWNAKAKAAWKALTLSASVTDIMGFDPLKDVSQHLLMEGQKIGNPQVVGIWEGNGSVRIGVMATPSDASAKKILVGVMPAPLRPWSMIRLDPKMI